MLNTRIGSRYPFDAQAGTYNLAFGNTPIEDHALVPMTVGDALNFSIDTLSGFTGLSGGVFARGVSVVADTRDGLLTVNDVRNGDLASAVTGAALQGGGRVGAVALDRTARGLVQTSGRPTLALDAETGVQTLLCPGTTERPWRSISRPPPTASWGSVWRRPTAPREWSRERPRMTTSGRAWAGAAAEGRHPATPPRSGAADDELPVPGAGDGGDAGGGDRPRPPAGSDTPGDDDLGDLTPGGGERTPVPPSRRTTVRGVVIPFGYLRVNHEMRVNPEGTSLNIRFELNTSPIEEWGPSQYGRFGWYREANDADVGISAGAETGTRYLGGGSLVEGSYRVDNRTGLSRNVSVRDLEQEFLDARAAGAPVRGLAAQEVMDFLEDAGLVVGDRVVDLEALDRLAGQERTPHGVFENIPEQQALPVLDVDALPLTPEGSVLLPDLPLVDQPVLDAARDFQEPHVSPGLPPLPVMDDQGNPVVVDLPGDTSGALAYDEQGNPVLIELPYAVAGPPTTDAEGRPPRPSGGDAGGRRPVVAASRAGGGPPYRSPSVCPGRTRPTSHSLGPQALSSCMDDSAPLSCDLASGPVGEWTAVAR